MPGVFFKLLFSAVKARPFILSMMQNYRDVRQLSYKKLIWNSGKCSPESDN